MLKMSGIILMIVGVITFASGALVYRNSIKENKSKANTLDIENKISKQIDERLGEQIAQSEARLRSAQKSEIEKIRTQELEKIIDMAIADGVLTENEKRGIHKYCIDNAHDYNRVLREVEKKLSTSDIDTETEIIDYKVKNGLDFEKFIVKKFNKDYFTIIDWAGDKYVEGRYSAKNLDPDIRFKLNLKDKKTQFSIECKWIQKLNSGGFEFNERQLSNYKNYERKEEIPVFVAIGIGNSGEKPDSLYVVPLRNIKYNKLNLEYLKWYKKDIDDDFFYDVENQKLK